LSSKQRRNKDKRLIPGVDLDSTIEFFHSGRSRVRFLLVSPFLFASLLVLTGCSKPQASNGAEKTIVGAQPAEALGGANLADSAPEYIGTVRASDETDFSFKVGGILEMIGPQPHRDWEEGSRVNAGSVLARLQQGDFKNALAGAKAAAELAAANNERLRKLLADNVVSKQEMDKGKADAETAEAQLRQAEQNLGDSELLAPKSGVVFKRYVNSGETVGAGKPVLRFGDTGTMSVELGVPDRLVNLFSVNKQIDVDISALAGRPPFRGKISEVGVAASNAGRLYRVVIKVANPDGIIKSGMTATVKAGSVAASVAGQVLVPLSAVIAPSTPNNEEKKPQTQLAIFVVKDGNASLRPIKTGDIIASSIIVTDGLKPGEMVVTKGASLLYDGAPVEVR
jgi:multidrug efflux system membrane fusion protein